MAGVVPKFSRTPGTIAHPGPLLGEHTVEIVTGLAGVSAATVEQLLNDGILAAAPGR